MKRSEFDKHIKFMPHWDDPQKFAFCGPTGWIDLTAEQSKALRELEDEFVLAAALYKPKNEEEEKQARGFLAFGIFIVPGLTALGEKRGGG